MITGYDDGTFRGTNAVTRNEFITIVARILQKEKGLTVPNLALTYSDVVADWVADYVRIAKSENVILDRTDGAFAGDTLISRGDAAITMGRLYKAIN